MNKKIVKKTTKFVVTSKKDFVVIIIFSLSLFAAVIAALTASLYSLERQVNPGGVKSSSVINVVSDFKTKKSINKSLIYQCSKVPVKISALNSGDVFGSLKISAIDGNFCEKDCEEDYSGRIYFKGEQILSGTLVLAESGSGLFFYPDKHSALPDLSRGNSIDQGKKLSEIKGLVCGSPNLMIENSEIAKKEIAKKIPELNDLQKNMTTGSSEEKYNKKVIIKVKNMVINYATGGESGTTVTFVELIDILQ